MEVDTQTNLELEKPSQLNKGRQNKLQWKLDVIHAINVKKSEVETLIEYPVCVKKYFRYFHLHFLIEYSKLCFEVSIIPILQRRKLRLRDDKQITIDLLVSNAHVLSLYIAKEP